MVYGYLRVSSDKQDYNNQKVGVDELAKRNGWTINKYIVDDGISGTVAANKRNLGKQLLPRLTEGDIIICSELSRLGRKLLMVFDLLQYIMEKKAIVYTVKDNFVLGDNVQSMVLAFAFSLAAQIERDMISQRTKEALSRLKAQGIILGRPKGRKTLPELRKLYPKRETIINLMNERVSLRQIAKIVKVDRNTLHRYVNEDEELSALKEQNYSERHYNLLSKDRDTILELIKEGQGPTSIAKIFGVRYWVVTRLIKNDAELSEARDKSPARDAFNRKSLATRIGKRKAMPPQCEICDKFPCQYTQNGTGINFATMCKNYKVRLFDDNGDETMQQVRQGIAQE